MSTTKPVVTTPCLVVVGVVLTLWALAYGAGVML